MITCQDISWITEHCFNCHTRHEDQNTVMWLGKHEGDLIQCCCLAFKLLYPHDEFTEQLLCDDRGYTRGAVWQRFVED